MLQSSNRQMKESVDEKSYAITKKWSLSGKHQKNEEIIIEKEKINKKIEQENTVIKNILKNYDASRHSDCILEILKSEISMDNKKMIIDNLNEQYRLRK